ncbi:3-oxoacyl-[acyl-carrier-protein] reductase [Desulfonatronum thiosulfatophilum]|uniref:3-oxoacyl-[acyl-carrier-protein] reductase n=1 Tax=Desulfonatronum thiosulfatophilum TaxID=617002 RepID=A0A1G6DWY5_9BACT|nr:3-oxoacyl-[acyl-carrier-protein] reductase [Desulfonatronum thiosulfatophilum]SDB49664.1 3-oxoacyl-[acyl-carrier-protein] reductase [Desulfonatronum thiosulfatophilum]
MSEMMKTALVTGASRGIGRSIALRLAQDGYQVYLTYVSKPELAEAVRDMIVSRGGNAAAFRLDVGDAAAVTAYFKEHVKDKVRLEVLVNNAGLTKDNLIIRMKPEDWDAVMRVNLTGSFVCLQEAAKVMIRQRYGRIINISSVVGQMGNAGQANYAASKAGLIGLTKSAALELASRGITVNAVAPGFIDTDMTAGLSEDIQKVYMDRIPARRFGQAEEIAETVAFLATESASYITGQVIGVTGGLYM